jgi:hypothetical protein
MHRHPKVLAAALSAVGLTTAFGTAGAQAAVARPAAKISWAVVKIKADGSPVLLRRSGATTVQSVVPPGPAIYDTPTGGFEPTAPGAPRVPVGVDVVFNRDVRKCAFLATAGDSLARPTVRPAQIAVARSSRNVRAVFVRSSPDLRLLAPFGFHLLVVC